MMNVVIEADTYLQPSDRKQKQSIRTFEPNKCLTYSFKDVVSQIESGPS